MRTPLAANGGGPVGAGAGHVRTALALLLASILLLATPAVAVAASVQTTLPAIERQAMCVTCKIPLDEAQSPQADRERAFIRTLIEEGRSETQVKSALVSQYGSSVLALPSAKGFDVTVYAVPVAVVLALLGLLAILLPAWRRRARAARKRSEQAPSQLSADDAARLDADMARFD